MSGGVDPVGPEPVYTLPAEVLEVGFLIYKKNDITLPASWPNSGKQTFIAAQPGTDWFTEFPGELPAHVCGDGWAVQQDQIAHDGTFVWPTTIQYPDNVLSKLGVLVDTQHTDLELYVMVPDCVTATEQPAPVPEPELAATGVLTDPLIIAAIGFSILALGFALLVAVSFSRSRLPKPRSRRKGNTSVSGVSPFPNLLGKK